MAHRPPPLSSLCEWYHFDHGNLLIKNYYVFITPPTHTILPLLYPAFNISFVSFSPPPPPPCHTPMLICVFTPKFFTTIFGHEFISITKENAYQIVLVCTFLFPICRCAGLTAKKKPSLTGPPLLCLGNLSIGGRGIFF